MLMAPISCSFESFAQSDHVRKSCRYSDHLVSGEIRRYLVNNHDGTAVASAACFGRLLHKKFGVCPEHPSLCSGGLCYGFFLS